METGLVGSLQLLSEYLGIPVSVLLVILALVMSLAFSSFGLLNFGSSWGLLLGMVPIVAGSLLGLLPIWVIFICIIPILSLLYSRFSSFGRREEGEEVLDISGVPEVPKLSKATPSLRKPPWAK